MARAGRTTTGRLWRALVLLAATGGITAAGMTLAPAAAVEPGEILDDPVLEERARDLSRDLRCLVCQNQSIDDSNADLARDLRLLVRERLVAGDSDDQVIDYVTDRYGDYVLLTPPVKPQTYLLWFFPAILFAFGLLATVRYLHSRRDGAGPVALSDADSTEARAILARAGAPDGGGPDRRGPA